MNTLRMAVISLVQQNIKVAVEGSSAQTVDWLVDYFDNRLIISISQQLQTFAGSRFINYEGFSAFFSV